MLSAVRRLKVRIAASIVIILGSSRVKIQRVAIRKDECGYNRPLAHRTQVERPYLVPGSKRDAQPATQSQTRRIVITWSKYSCSMHS